MTRQILSTPTEVLFYDLADLLGHEYVSPADRKRIDRLAAIVAKRQGVSIATVLDSAQYELADLAA